MPSTNKNQLVTLYRGLAIEESEVEAVVSEIQQIGLQKVNGMVWQNEMPSPNDIRTRHHELIESPGSIRDEIREMASQPILYACGDRAGASYYALAHGASSLRPCGVLVEFQAPIDNLVVDGKDLLYTVFQLWDRSGTDHRGRVREILRTLFGERILFYFDLAADCRETMERIGFCDLACHDLDVIAAHFKNRTLIRGRYQTAFQSSFHLQVPVAAERVISVEKIEALPPTPSESIQLRDVIR